MRNIYAYMKHLCLVVFVMLCVPSLAQNTRVQEEKKAKLEREIAIIDKQLKENASKSSSMLADLSLIRKKVSNRKELVAESDRQIRKYNDDIYLAQLKINRMQMLNTVRRVSVCANKASNHIKLDMQPGSLEISAQDLGFSIAAYEKMQCQYDGEPLTIGFKSPFIIEILSNMNCGELVMKFLDSKRAALILPAEEEEESGKICGIIMPIMIS